MKELDENYKRLVKAKYCLRTKTIISKNDLNREVKNIVINRETLISISEDIADCINEWKDDEMTKPCISHTTLGRMMGVYGKNAEGEISRSNLDRIAKYIGRESWSDLSRDDWETIEEDMLREYKLAEDSGFKSQLDDGENNLGTGLRRLLSHNLLTKQIVNIHYGNGRQLQLQKLSEGDKFIVRYCDSKVLEKGWVISIPCFFVGVNIVGLDIRYNGDKIKDYYKSSGPITSIKVENEW